MPIVQICDNLQYPRLHLFHSMLVVLSLSLTGLNVNSLAYMCMSFLSRTYQQPVVQRLWCCLSLSGDIRSLCFLFLTDPSLADVNTCFTSPLKSSIGIWSLSIWCIIFWCWYLFKSPQHSSTYIWSLSLFCRMVFHFQTSIWNSALFVFVCQVFLTSYRLVAPPPISVFLE